MSRFPVINGKCVNCNRKFLEGDWHDGCEGKRNIVLKSRQIGVTMSYEDALKSIKFDNGSEIIIESTASDSVHDEPFWKLFSRSFRPWGSNIVYVDFEKRDRE